MDKSLKLRISERRRLLGNPYAHVENLDAIESEAMTEQAPSSLDHQIQASRQLFQDPYAYLNDSGGYSAEVNHDDKKPTRHQPIHSTSIPTPSNPAKNARAPRRYTDREIEALTKDLHTRLWRNKESLWDGAPPANPIDLLDPAIALRLTGYEYSLEEGLGRYRGAGGYIEVAGLIDRASKIVRVSRQFSMNVRTFTAAHELGHAVLHQAGGGVHRDRPLDGAILSRDPNEREADKFATYFLMPEKLVRVCFANLFRANVFELNDGTAFALSGASVDEIQEQCHTRRDLSRLLASAERYNGRHFVSLAAQFRVSTESMAIRLEELELIA